ncbi:MAG: hypothetical protein Q4A82_01075 [Corynebacterium sp.]|nr:hypothetical protein [Corynebacterium sp.]
MINKDTMTELTDIYIGKDEDGNRFITAAGSLYHREAVAREKSGGDVDGDTRSTGTVSAQDTGNDSTRNPRTAKKDS